jgi:HAE1 family hydrophobic/amphiphilic exporter-1
MPLALGGSTVGGLFYFPLARTVMGGLISSAFFTLLALPSITICVEFIGDYLKRIWQRSAPRPRAMLQPAGAVTLITTRPSS